jgi:hypothetical protein
MTAMQRHPLKCAIVIRQRKRADVAIRPDS